MLNICTLQFESCTLLLPYCFLGFVVWFFVVIVYLLSSLCHLTGLIFSHSYQAESLYEKRAVLWSTQVQNSFLVVTAARHPEGLILL